MCQALCQASSKRTLPLNVHASGRRTRAGGWQRAWGLGAEKGRSDLVGQGAGEGSSVEVPRAGPGRRGYRCPLSSPLVADISRMVPGAQALPASPWGPPPRPPARFLLPWEPWHTLHLVLWASLLAVRSAGHHSLLPRPSDVGLIVPSFRR